MLERLAKSATQSMHTLRRRWPLVLAGLLAGGWILFAFWLSDVQGRMDLPTAYSIRMTCEDDPEAALWRGGCERIASDIAKAGRPGFLELYDAFVEIHHRSGPRAATAARFAETAPQAGFDLTQMLAGQRYGLALMSFEFEGVRSQAHAEAVMDAIDVRDRALLVVGRAGLGHDALFAGALANLVHPGAMIEGVWQYVAILLGTAKTSDFATGLSERR